MGEMRNRNARRNQINCRLTLPEENSYKTPAKLPHPQYHNNSVKGILPKTVMPHTVLLSNQTFLKKIRRYPV